MKWIDNLKPEDLPGDLQLVAVHCGMDVAIKLAEKMGSITLYICSIESIVSEAKKAYIIKNFKGSNHKQLAIDAGCSERWVYQVIEEHRRASQVKQRPLFNIP